MSLPQLLVIWDVVVTGFTFSKLEESSVTIEPNIQSFELFGISLIETEDQCLVWNLFTLDWNVLSAEINFAIELLDVNEFTVSYEFTEYLIWIIIDLVQAGEHLVVSILRSTVCTLVELVLAAQSVVTFKSKRLFNQSVNLSADQFMMMFDSYHIVAISHHLHDLLLSSSVKA